ncbi:unnamed protein product [Onchocerca flexuosa]|uniref:Uncharacterized protein n=1 Tax=Onchocerca flexuosa TaxID=387005 RepID=A0A183HLE3_9BILA|nr:unnamed protein product [Onchocerca flexuosa]
MDSEPENSKILEVAGGDQWSKNKNAVKSKGTMINSLDDLKTIFHNLLHPKNNKIVDQAFEQIEQKTHLGREKVIFDRSL